MFPVLGFGVAGLGLAFAALLSPERPILRYAALGVLVLVALIAVAGWQMGLSNIEAALTAVDPSQADALRAQGEREASVPLWFAGGLDTVGGLVLAAALVRARR